MADVNASTLMTSAFLTESVNQVIMNENSYIGKEYLPVALTNENVFKVKINKNNVKPIEDVAGNASSPVRGIRGNNLIKYTGIPYREKIVISADDSEYMEMIQYLEGFRNINPSNATELGSLQARHQELLSGLVRDCSLAVESGLEKLRWAALSGTLTTSVHGTVDYNFAGGRKPTAGVLWSVSATATPIANLRAWIALFRSSGYRAKEIVMNQAVYNEMIATSEVIAYLQGTGLSIALATEAKPVERAIGIPIRIYDQFYDTSTNPDSPSLTEFAPDDKVFIIGENEFGDPSLGKIYLGPTPENNFAPGVYVNVVDMSQADPRKIEIRFGFKGLPSLYFDNGDGMVYASV